MRTKRLIGWTAAVAAGLGLALWIALGATIYLEAVQIRRHTELVVAPFNNLAAQLSSATLPTDMGERLSRLPKDAYWIGYAVVDPTALRVLAGDRPEMFGKVLQEVVTVDGGRSRTYAMRDIHTGDGHTYYLTALQSDRGLGYSAALHNIFGFGGILAIAVAWLALALWIFLDARLRTPAVAPAWALLGLLSGPLGLGVYRVLRSPLETCPGCGETQDPEGLFCPHCGHALRPACPDCHRPVQHAWRYCRACGAPLQEPSGGSATL